MSTDLFASYAYGFTGRLLGDVLDGVLNGLDAPVIYLDKTQRILNICIELLTADSEP